MSTTSAQADTQLMFPCTMGAGVGEELMSEKTTPIPAGYECWADRSAFSASAAVFRTKATRDANALRAAFRHPYKSVVQAALANPACPPDLLNEAAEDTSGGTVYLNALATREHNDSECWEKLYREGSTATRNVLAKNPATPPGILRALASRKSFTVKAHLAGNPAYPFQDAVELALNTIKSPDTFNHSYATTLNRQHIIVTVLTREDSTHAGRLAIMQRLVMPGHYRSTIGALGPSQSRAVFIISTLLDVADGTLPADCIDYLARLSLPPFFALLRGSKEYPTSGLQSELGRVLRSPSTHASTLLYVMQAILSQWELCHNPGGPSFGIKTDEHFFFLGGLVLRDTLTHPTMPVEVVEQMSMHPWQPAREAALENPACPEHARVAAALFESRIP